MIDCRDRLKTRPRSSLSISARMIGTGNESSSSNADSTSVLRISIMKVSSVKNRTKWSKPTHSLPPMPRNGM